MITIREATDLNDVRELFREYQAAVNAPVCFASFDAELAGLPGPYVTLLVSDVNGSPAGCVALKPLADQTAEVKRLYVRPAFRRLGLGEQLMRAVASAAQQLGYTTLRLDTLPFMTAAIELYHRLGYVPVDRYNDNPEPSALFFELPINI